MRVKYLAQEHNTMSPARARTRSARSGVERANHEATAPPTGRGEVGRKLFSAHVSRRTKKEGLNGVLAPFGVKIC